MKYVTRFWTNLTLHSLVTLCHTSRDPLKCVTHLGSHILVVRVYMPHSALEFFPIHCPNGRLGQDLGFGGFAFALKLPELLNTNLPTVRAKLGQTSCFPNGPQIWFPIGK